MKFPLKLSNCVKSTLNLFGVIVFCGCFLHLGFCDVATGELVVAGVLQPPNAIIPNNADSPAARGADVTPSDLSKSVVAKFPSGVDSDSFIESLQLSQGFVHAFVASISVIIVSELGDKTFFIAAIMAMRHARLTVFAGAIAALGAMTVLSALGGTLVTKVIPRAYTYYLSAFLFFIFGLKMLKEGYDMSPDEGQEEYEEVQADLRRREEEVEKDVEAGGVSGLSTPSSSRRVLRRFFPRVFIQSLTLTFLAEWGDRSQIATIVLAAREDIAGVVIGGTLGHALCTGLAVVGGRMIAQRISVRTVTIVGGVVFIFFALSAFFITPSD